MALIIFDLASKKIFKKILPQLKAFLNGLILLEKQARKI